MKTSTVAKSLAAALVSTRTLAEALCDQLNTAIVLANALAEDAVERESASAAAQAQQADTARDEFRVFGRRDPIGTEPGDEATEKVAPNAVGIVPAGDTPTG